MRRTTLDQVCISIVDGPFGSSLKTSDYVDKGIPVLQGKNITGDKFVWKDIRYISRKKAKEVARSSAVVGDQIVIKIGSIGYSAILDDLNGHEYAIIPANLARLRPDRAMIDDRFLHHWLKSDEMKGHFRSVASSTAQPALSLGKIRQAPIPLPPLEEQKRIAAILDQADALRRLRARALDRLNALGQAIFHEMFGDPRTNPKGWPTSPLSNIGELERGISKHRPRNDPALLGGEHPLIQTGDVSRAGDYIEQFSSTYSGLGLQQSRKWPKGTLCITIAANIADTAILDFDACFPDSVVGFDSGSEATNFFVHRWFATVKAHLEQVAPTVAQKNINLAILRQISIIRPPSNLIEKFFAREVALRNQKSVVAKAATRAEAFFSSLQHRAFRGEL